MCPRPRFMRSGFSSCSDGCPGVVALERREQRRSLERICNGWWRRAWDFSRESPGPRDGTADCLAVDTARRAGICEPCPGAAHALRSRAVFRIVDRCTHALPRRKAHAVPRSYQATVILMPTLICLGYLFIAAHRVSLRRMGIVFVGQSFAVARALEPALG
jgi:hypothetical protein